MAADGFGERQGAGSRPALVVVDLVDGFTDPRRPGGPAFGLTSRDARRRHTAVSSASDGPAPWRTTAHARRALASARASSWNS